MNKKCLLLGGAGFIGSVLTEYLITSGYDVCVYDRMMYEKTSLISHIGYGQRFSFIKGDVRNTPELKKLIPKYDIIINLAALVGASLCEKYVEEAWNVNSGTNNTIQNVKSKDQIIIFNNTNSGYGLTDGNTLITEKDPLTPTSVYGRTKCCGEDIVRQMDNHLVFRLATVFGISTRPRTDLLVNNLVYKAMKDKYIVLYENQAMRNYIHIQDVCSGVRFALENWDQCKNDVYNLGNDQLNMSKLDLCKVIQKHIPFEIIQAEYTKDPDQRNYVVSSQKFYDKGFSCQKDLDYGITELMKMYSMIEDDFIVHANY